jgi:hypothetical protein
MNRLSLRILVPILILAACQSGPGTGRSTHGNSNLITAQELAELEESAVLTAKQAVQRLRPRWLQARSAGYTERHTPAVFRDGVPMGGLERLEEMDIRTIQEIRYLSGSDATNRYGTGYPGGIIMVATKGRP